MIRILNVAAIAALVASALYAYSIKYKTMFRAETVARLRAEIKSEQDNIGILRADWANLTRPERVQALAERLTTLQPLQLNQIVKVDAIPDKGPRGDAIGRELDQLGLGEPTNTPSDATPNSATPSSKPARRAAR